MFRLMVFIALLVVGLLCLAHDRAGAQKMSLPAAVPPAKIQPLNPLPPALPDARLDLPPSEMACTPERKAKGDCEDTAAAPLLGSPTTPPPMFGRGPGKL